LTYPASSIPEAGLRFIEEGLRRSKSIDCFDFVPSNHQVVYSVLLSMPRGRFCEWGSGIGIVTGLAEMLGFEACGIEIDERLAAASRVLLADFGLSSAIETGSYFDISRDADTYFVYCWADEIPGVEQHFLSATPHHATLLICHGAEDVRRKVKPRE
jgi:hypothetical protein